MNNNIKTGEVLSVSKTTDKFLELEFHYPNGDKWVGCYPIHYRYMGIDYAREDIEQFFPNAYEQISPQQIDNSIEKTRKRWSGATNTETYKVFSSLLTGKWVCRSCGSGKINDQPAARIRDIKSRGFVIATKSRYCSKCKKNQYHDLLLVFDINAEKKGDFRLPISNILKDKIIEILGKKDVFFDVDRPNKDFVIDHKFSSQRWVEVESDNNLLDDKEIRAKFQLLTNQSNMLKSRLCDKCCETGIRPSFLGIEWFYSGSKQWNEEDGCHGCPWYDLELWKQKLNEKINR